jgi:hypothetical protein
MTAEPAGDYPAAAHEVIQVHGEAAVAVPVAEYRRLRALQRIASPQELEDAEIEATLTAHREWVAAGRPGARPHAEVRRVLLGLDPG